jgi:hypothetical protein
MLLVVEEVDESEKILAVKVGAISLDIPQKFDFINRLIEVVFVILDNLHADHLFSMNIVTLDSL